MNRAIALLFALCSMAQAEKVTMLLKMIPEQERFYRETFLVGFEKAEGCTVAIETFADNGELTDKAGNAGLGVDVVKVPMGMAQPMVEKKLVVPLQMVVGEKGIAEVKSEYYLLNLAEVEGVLYYVPRKFETRIMVYRKSRVKDAVKGWKRYEVEVGDALKRWVGGRLPTGYTLEDDPGKWDFYDILVAGHYWAGEPYDGSKVGRIAHRGKNYSGTALGLMDRCFQAGATQSDILTPKSDYMREVLRWESLYAGLGVYAPGMVKEGWSGSDIWKAFGDGKVFLSFLTQIDCFFLHGTDSPSMDGYLKNPDDLGFALMPAFAELGGQPRGTRSVSTGGWLWGIGSRAANGELAFKLIRYITNYNNQILEYHRFGIIPVRKDILGKANIVFREPWKAEVFGTSITQLKTNGRTSLPYSPGIEAVEKEYIGLWYKVMQGSIGGYMGDEAISALLK